MAILHGNWLINSDNNSYFFVWGETWRKISHSAQDIHPFVMSESELLDFLLKYDLSLDNLSFSEENILLPNQFPISQIFSDSDLKLQSWKINGMVLNSVQTIKFLQALPLTDEQFLGGDLRFWTQVGRWSLDLIARCKFLPNLIQKDNYILSRWQPLLDSSLDQARLAKFSQTIPLICLSYINPHPPTPSPTGEGEYVVSHNYKNYYNHSEPQSLILNFLSEMIDTNIRLWSQNQAIPKTVPLINNWFKRLSSKNNILETSPSVKRLQSVLNNWMTPIQDYVINDDSSQGKGITEKLFRTCFILQPPGENQADWKLEYVLQAIDQPDFIIDNQTIWQNPVNSLNYHNRTIESPQETFLKGLGLGAKIYPVILESLNESQPEYCILNPVEAYQFIQGISWKLQDHGLGVIIPESLAQSRNDNKRLGLKISATTEEKTAGLGLQSLLKFQWEL
ncbi:MAG TPA: SNF2 helicase-associated domain-containing protein, partial [Allocoleopsis sp.]